MVIELSGVQFGLKSVVWGTNQIAGSAHDFYMNMINNGNWAEWSAVWSEIMRVISKSNECVARVWFEFTSMISDQNCTTRGLITF